MNNFEYIYPQDSKSIPVLLSEKRGESMLFAGGTDALSRLKEGIVQPKQIINLKSVESLGGIEERRDGLHIGATTKLADLVKSPLARKLDGLLEAAKSIGTPQLRNMGTVGGNLCQRPRCWYFRSRHFPCLRKGGDVCFAVNGENKYHAILGGDPCFVVHPSDLAPMFIALDAKVSLKGPKGTKQIPLADLYVLPNQDVRNETILSPRQVLTEVVLPKTDAKTLYLKFRERRSFDFAMASVAIAARVTGKELKNVRVVFGGVAPKPWRALAAEGILEGNAITDQLLENAGNAEMAKANALEKNEYKIILTKNLFKRAVRNLISK